MSADEVTEMSNDETGRLKIESLAEADGGGDIRYPEGGTKGVYT